MLSVWRFSPVARATESKRSQWGRTRVMTQMQATTAEPTGLEAGQPLPGEAIGGKSANLPTQVISFAIGEDQ